MFKQLERLALQPQRWGLTGEAEECLGLCVFRLIWCFFLLFWYWLRWRRCGTTVVAGLQLEEESPLRAARLPDHWDDCLFWMTTADNERPDQEPTDCPRTSCIIYSPLVHRGFVFHINPGPRLCLGAAASAHTEQSKSTAAVWSVHLQRWRVPSAPGFPLMPGCIKPVLSVRGMKTLPDLVIYWDLENNFI